MVRSHFNIIIGGDIDPIAGLCKIPDNSLLEQEAKTSSDCFRDERPRHDYGDRKFYRQCSRTCIMQDTQTGAGMVLYSTSAALD